MATRIEIELTSKRDDDTFTWRRAGAKSPKGDAAVSLFPAEASIGETFTVDAEMDLDGITVTHVYPPKDERKEPERLELIFDDDLPLVTEQRAPKRRNERKGGRKGGKGRRDDRTGGGRGQRDRPPAKPKLPPKPKPPRLKAGRTHRKAYLDALPEEQRVVADKVIQGGMQAVRQELAKQNEELKAAGKPTVSEKESPFVALAEGIITKVRAAEWRDRAEAALEQAAEVDLRDLRQVVNAADGAARDDETRAMAAKLREALAERLEADQQAWVAEIVEMLDDDRVVRALHLSSRPPKAGQPLPPGVALRLVEMTNASMTKDITSDRWTHFLEALAHSPVRRQVVPESLPENPSADLKALIARLGDRLPEIAHIFGIAPDPKAGRPSRGRPKRPKKPAGGGTDQAKAKAKAKSTDEKPSGDQDESAAPPETKSNVPAAEPKADAPAEPKADAPAEPKADAPAEPTADAPAEATADAPAEPKADAPAEATADAPAEPKATTESQGPDAD